jgi:hypothetical protein
VSCLVRATVPKVVGKWGFQVHIDMSDSSMAVGIAGPTAAIGSALGFDAFGWGLEPSGVLLHSNSTLTTLATYTTGDTVTVLLDATNNLLWMAVDNGNYNNSGATDPANGIGGISVLGVPTYFPAASMAAGQATATFGPGGFFRPLPLGFAPWLP